MKKLLSLWTALSLTAAFAGPDAEGFTELLNGKDLTGWKASENPASFKVENGELIAFGNRAHLFYVGDFHGADFTDFEAKLKVMTKPSANAGFYFHTAFQDEGWPSKGYECQINATHKDPKKTGSLYGIVNVMDTAPHIDNEWFDYHIIVKGKTITIKVNGKETVTYTEPADGSLPDPKSPGRKLSNGTFAIQAHDPGSEVHIKSIRIKPL
ncbi:MAG: DUF1080 domain-containing protein [Verrucomicrobia bacterium]|nr:DUF1080 domain-containing protein [Verrucomicrobiota bacterium]